MISGVRKVIVPVADQQAALEFWTTGMGFELVRDDAYGDERWIEVTPTTVGVGRGDRRPTAEPTEPNAPGRRRRGSL